MIPNPPSKVEIDERNELSASKTVLDLQSQDIPDYVGTLMKVLEDAAEPDWSTLMVYVTVVDQPATAPEPSRLTAITAVAKAVS